MTGLTRFSRLVLVVTFFYVSYALPLMAQANPDKSSNLVELVRKAAFNYKARASQASRYTYLAHVVRTQFDGNAKPNGYITGAYEVMFLEGRPYQKITELNGEPLSPEQEKHEQTILDAEAAARRNGRGKGSSEGSPSTLIAELPEWFRLRSRARRSWMAVRCC